MDFSKLLGFDKAIVPMMQMQKDDFRKAGDSEVPFYDSFPLELGLPQNSIEGKLTLRPNIEREQRNRESESSSRFVENIKQGQANSRKLMNNCDLSGVSSVAIGFELGEFMNDPNEHFRRYGGSDVQKIGDMKKIQKGKAIIEHPNCFKNDSNEHLRRNEDFDIEKCCKRKRAQKGNPIIKNFDCFTNDSDENCKKNEKSNIKQSYKRNRAQKGNIMVKDSDWSPHEMGPSRHRRSIQKSKQIERRPLGNPVSEGNHVNVSNSRSQTDSSDKLKEMSFYSGWVGVSQMGDFITRNFMSPSGGCYQSLPQTVDVFSQGTSEQQQYLSSSFGNEESNINNYGGDSNDAQKKRGNYKSVGTSSGFIISTEDLGLTSKQTFNKDIAMEGTRSIELHGNMASCVVLEEVKSCIKDEYLSCETQKSNWCRKEVKTVDHSSTSNMQCEMRMPALTNGKHVLVDCEFDIGREDYNDYVGSSICFSKESSLLKGKVRYIDEVNKASTHCMVDEKEPSCMKDKCLSNETDKSNCEIVIVKVIKTNQSNSIDLNHVDEFHEATKPKEPDENCLGSSSCVFVESLVEHEEMGCKEVHEGAISTLINEKEKSYSKDECFKYDSEKLDCCGDEVEAHHSSSCKMDVGASSNCRKVEVVKIKQNKKMNTHRYGTSIGVRRSSRFNKKYVPRDSELESRVNESTEKRVKRLFDLNIEPGKLECDPPILGKALAKEIAKEKFECHEQGHEKSGTETSVKEKHSSMSMSRRKVLRRENANGKNRRKRTGNRLVVRRQLKDEHEIEQSSETKLTILAWLIDKGVLTENEKVVYKGNNCKSSVLKGWLTKSGIRCSCCMEVVSLLEFEAHANSDLRQPLDNTYASSGKSLMQCWSEAWEKEKKQRRIGFQMVGTNDPDPSDDSCGVCTDGGSLICCDNCPSTFHQNCLMLKSLPECKWYCPYCRCVFCMMVDQGRDTSTGSFMLCTCKQCGRKYHKECAYGHDILMMGIESTFCGQNCKKVATGLVDMLGVAHPIGEGYSWTLLRRFDDQDQGINIAAENIECNQKLSLAFSVLDECFNPLIDPRTGLDVISQAIYNCGSNYSRLNFERFHTIILEKDDEIISAATIRVHGTSLAEMPFIGTRPMYRRQGMCNRLMEAIEEMLSSLNVEKLIIPAIYELLTTWMTKFSFKPLELSHKEEIRNLSMLVFAKTSLLQKPIRSSATKKEARGGTFIPSNENTPLPTSPECILNGFPKNALLQNNIGNTVTNNDRGGTFIPSNENTPLPSSPEYILNGCPKNALLQNNIGNIVTNDDRGHHFVPSNQDFTSRLNLENLLQGYPQNTLLQSNACRMVTQEGHHFIPTNQEFLWRLRRENLLHGYPENTLLQNNPCNIVAQQGNGFISSSQDPPLRMRPEYISRGCPENAFSQNNILNTVTEDRQATRGGFFISSSQDVPIRLSSNHILEGYPGNTLLNNNIRNTVTAGGELIPYGEGVPLRSSPEYLDGHQETTPCQLISGDLPGRSPLSWNAKVAPPNLQMRTLIDVINRPMQHFPMWF